MANYNLDKTLAVAQEKLKAKEPEIMAQLSSTEYNQDNKTFRVPFLGEEYLVQYPEGKVTLAGNETQEVSLQNQILILHYLVTASGQPIQNQYISFKELPDGAIYIDPFTKRTINPMLKLFGHDLDLFKTTAAKLGGEIKNLGHAGVTINVFPKVPITYVIWEGDDEFPASGNVLFDASAGSYLPTEDYAVVASQVIWTLKALSNCS
ncbi:MAG: DUF3786 domain-containing protein [Clostridia bacterium]|nr:DUF3786 domain-containing protein [Clostridia bacterium]